MVGVALLGRGGHDAADQVVRPLLDLIGNPPDIFAENADRQQLYPVKKVDGYGQGRPAVQGVAKGQGLEYFINSVADGRALAIAIRAHAVHHVVALAPVSEECRHQFGRMLEVAVDQHRHVPRAWSIPAVRAISLPKLRDC
ncbi:MAG: hypothetical protein HYZ18_04105 [Pseudogulbenkiania sp.]|nr:hypothetical protein [Pseudogulbenkiania sp.]